MKTLNRIVINYGLAWTLLVIILFALQQLVEPQSLQAKILGWLNYLGGFIMVYLAVVQYRKLENRLTITDGFKIGILMSLLSGVLLGLYVFVYFNYINPGAVDKILSVTYDKMIAQGTPEEQARQSLEFAKKFFAVIGFAGSIISQVFIGVLSGLAVGVWKRTE